MSKTSKTSSIRMIRCPENRHYLLPWEETMETDLRKLLDSLRRLLMKQKIDQCYEDLYRLTYKAVLTKHGAYLYEEVNRLIVGFLTQVRKKVAQLSEDQFLAELNGLWSHYNATLLKFQAILIFMERQFVEKNNLENTESLGLRIFRDDIVFYEEIRDRVRISMRDNRRRGGIVAPSVLRSAYEMLMILGKGTANVYQEVCEGPFLTLYAKLLRSVRKPVNTEICLFGREQYRYSLTTNILGSGTYGRVHRADIIGALKKQITSVAVKVFPLSTELENQIAWNSLCRRLQMLPELSHLNLVRYHKVAVVGVSYGKQVEIVMDLCGDGDLSKLMKQYKNSNICLGLGTALRYAMDIANGLTFLHSNNIIHGDLKPANVLVLSERLVIGDLDGSIPMQHFVSCAADAENLAGTLHYMAPEVLRKLLVLSLDEILGRKADIWSLGCIFLDLAERVIDARMKRLCKVDQHSIHLLEIGKSMKQHDYVKFLVEEGYSPFVDPAIPACSSILAECIVKCLILKADNRSSAEAVLNLLRTGE